MQLGYCISFETVFVCLHVRLICALNYYLLLTYDGVDCGGTCRVGAGVVLVVR